MRIGKLNPQIVNDFKQGRLLTMECPSCRQHPITIPISDIPREGRHHLVGRPDTCTMQPAFRLDCTGFTFWIKNGYIMPQDENGNWYPHLFEKQLKVFNSQKQCVLASGPSCSGKTWAILHRIVRHLYETPDASYAMFSKTMKNSKEGGTWMDMHKIIIPEWVNAGIGFKYTTLNAAGEPGFKIDGQTRTPFFRVRNCHGGESECRLFSLDHDEDIEDKIKEQRFSGIYFSELSKFHDRKVLSVTSLRLRMPHLVTDQHQWCADTNPCEDGETCWIFQVWFRERTMSHIEYVEDCQKRGIPPSEPDVFESYRNDLELVEIMPAENPHLSVRELNRLKKTYDYDPDLYARYVLGKWVYGGGDASRHFRTFFHPNLHVVGDAAAADPIHWTVLNPSPACNQLITGWDLGDTNHAACVWEKIILGKQRAVYHLLAELVSLKEDISNEAFTDAFMKLIEGEPDDPESLKGLEEVIGHPVDLEPAWSDRSSIDKYSATGDTYPYKQVFVASNERIFLKGVPKAHGSVVARVQLLKKLLQQKRIRISAHCTWAIQMLKELRKGRSATLSYVVPDENKHIFDAMTYPLLMEESEDMDRATEASSRARSTIELHL